MRLDITYISKICHMSVMTNLQSSIRETYLSRAHIYLWDLRNHSAVWRVILCAI